MLKAVLLVSVVLFVFSLRIDADASRSPETSSATFLKPKANVMRRLNPLKLLFSVVHTPNRTPPYAVEWNFSFLKTMLTESSDVSEEDKQYFLENFGRAESEYARWTAEEHEALERFTEKYFNLYQSPDAFLPFRDCAALTYAITDEMLHDLQPNIPSHKRGQIRSRATQRLCDAD